MNLPYFSLFQTRGMLNRDLHKHVHAFSMYIPAGMLNCIQEQMSVMSQLTTQLRSRAYATALSHRYTVMLQL